MSETTGAVRTLLPVLSAARPWLEQRGVPDARRNAEELLAFALNCTRLDLYLDHDRPLSPTELECFRGLLRRRGRREPLQYLLGRHPFRQLELKVDARALIPRPETEELVEHLLTRERVLTADGPLHCLDLGTGSGCIALSLLKELPDCRVTALDRSADALALCAENARDLGLGAGLEPLQLDFLTQIPVGPWQVIVSNPPYVPPDFRSVAQPELAFEPPLALYTADPEGLEFYRRLAGLLPHLLVPGGRVYLEIGHDQGEAVQGLFRESLVDASVLPDLAGRDRFLIGRRP